MVVFAAAAVVATLWMVVTGIACGSIQAKDVPNLYAFLAVVRQLNGR